MLRTHNFTIFKVSHIQCLYPLKCPMRQVLPLRKSKDPGIHLGVCILRKDPLLKHSAPNPWQNCGLVSLPACLPLTSSLPGLPVCRWGAKPQNLRVSKITKAQTFPCLLALSPPLTPVYSLGSTFAQHSSQRAPLVNQALCCSIDQPLPLFLPFQILPIPQGPGLTRHLLANFLTCQLGVTSLFSAIHSSLYLS